MQMDWSNLELVAFSKGTTARGLVCLPSDNILRELSLPYRSLTFQLPENPLAGKVTWKIRAYTDR